MNARRHTTLAIQQRVHVIRLCFCDRDVAFYGKDDREIPLVSKGKNNHNMCGVRLDCGSA